VFISGQHFCKEDSSYKAVLWFHNIWAAESELSQTDSSTLSERESRSDEYIDRHFPRCLEPGRHVVVGGGEGGGHHALPLDCYVKLFRWVIIKSSHVVWSPNSLAHVVGYEGQEERYVFVFAVTMAISFRPRLLHAWPPDRTEWHEITSYTNKSIVRTYSVLRGP
jgi:hypothetical protein